MSGVCPRCDGERYVDRPWPVGGSGDALRRPCSLCNLRAFEEWARARRRGRPIPPSAPRPPSEPAPQERERRDLE